MDVENLHGENVQLSGESVILMLREQLKAKNQRIEELEKKLSKADRKVGKLEKYNDDLRSEFTQLNLELHQFRTKNLNLIDASEQVDAFEIEEAYRPKPMPEWGLNLDDGGLSIVDSLKATAEAVVSKQCSEVSSEEQGQNNNAEDKSEEYVYDQSSGLYYHPATGYYWDPTSQLFYDYTSGVYYQYESSSGQYKVYSQLSSTREETQPEVEEMAAHVEDRIQPHMKKKKRHLKRRVKRLRKSRDKFKNESSDDPKEQSDAIATNSTNNSNNSDVKHCDKNREVEHCKDKIDASVSSSGSDSDTSDSLATGESEMVSSEVESGELSSSTDSDVEVIEVTPIQSAPHIYTAATGDEQDTQDELCEQHPPCIRVIVLESQCLTKGSLYIITLTGGTIGRLKSSENVIEIPDVNVSKEHARVYYDEVDCVYQISDQNSQNGTFLNGVRLKQNCRETLKHGDTVSVCGSYLLLHIHSGSDTCDDCEPGQVQAKMKTDRGVYNDHVVLTKAEKNLQRRQEMKLIKKKYGLQHCKFDTSGSVLSDKYTDKAEKRRKTVGSDPHIGASSQPASVHKAIKASNKGHNLLSKMGWKEGEGLGKDGSGIVEPIQTELRVNKVAGLGSAGGVLSLDNVHDVRKAQRWSQAKQRFQKLEAAKDTTVNSWVKGDSFI